MPAKGTSRKSNWGGYGHNYRRTQIEVSPELGEYGDILTDLDEEECYLLALVLDNSGIDLAEFLWLDEMADNDEGIFRAWDFQYSWWRDDAHLILDQAARSIGKTRSIELRAWTFPLRCPGDEMVLTAPEMMLLSPLLDRVVEHYDKQRITAAMVKQRRKWPFSFSFSNGARVLGRIPQKDGKGIKGVHPRLLEMDEAQDYPSPGWMEIIETLRFADSGAQWRAHGVSRGIRDEFFRHSQDGSGWKVHRMTACHRPTWSDEERRSKIELYGSRESPDYKRNVLGLHGDATNPMFVLHRLMAIVDSEEFSEYNTETYYRAAIHDEQLLGKPDKIANLLHIPPEHKDWTTTWAGMDVGLTDAPSEILVCGEEATDVPGKTRLRLLTRIRMERIRSGDQRRVIEALFDFYNLNLFTMDRGGIGFPVYQDLQLEAPDLMNRIAGYTADEKVLVGWEPHEDWQDPDDFAIFKPAKEHGYDLARQYVDGGRFVLPWDRDLLGEWQGQRWVRIATTTNAYGKRVWTRGKFHTLDAMSMLLLGKELKPLQVIKKTKKQDVQRTHLVFA